MYSLLYDVEKKTSTFKGIPWLLMLFLFNILEKQLFGITIIPEKRCWHKNMLAEKLHWKTLDASFPYCHQHVSERLSGTTLWPSSAQAEPRSPRIIQSSNIPLGIRCDHGNTIVFILCLCPEPTGQVVADHRLLCDSGVKLIMHDFLTWPKEIHTSLSSSRGWTCLSCIYIIVGLTAVTVADFHYMRF